MRPVRPGEFSAICRECLVKTTTTHTRLLADWGAFPTTEVTPATTESRDDADAIWTIFDRAFSTFNTLEPIMRKMAEGKDPLEHQWDGGPVDEPPTRMMDNLAMMCALLERHGYREVSVVTGNCIELARSRQLGRFSPMYRGPNGEPHWTAKLVFAKV